MSFNERMHPRNLYKNAAPNFEKLAERSSGFRQYLREIKPGHWTVNFKDPEALRALTCVLLEQDFGLSLSLPLDRLIPTVPLRLNYILWIEDLLACLPVKPQGEIVRGFDIGEASICVIPCTVGNSSQFRFNFFFQAQELLPSILFLVPNWITGIFSLLR